MKMLDDGVMLVLVFFLVPSRVGIYAHQVLRCSSLTREYGFRSWIFLFFVGAEGGGCGDGVEIAGPLNPPLHYSRFFKSSCQILGPGFLHPPRKPLCCTNCPPGRRFGGEFFFY